MHRRLQGMFPQKYSKPFLGNVQAHPDELSKPIERKKPTVWFVCSMSDLFHQDVTFLSIDEIFAVMEKCPQHTFQVLTKRADRMLRYYHHRREHGLQWPSNVWAGVSAENQQYLVERVNHLLQIPAPVRFLSCEPILGRLSLSSWLMWTDVRRGIDWVIAGGESGHNARPMHPDWLRSIRDECADYGVPFFFKQWGEYVPVEDDAQPPFLNFPHNGDCVDGHHLNICDPETGEAGKYQGHRFMDPMDAITFCMEEGETDCNFWKIGKANAGNFIDGKQHLAMPQLNQPI
jgi:protein gp37